MGYKYLGKGLQSTLRIVLIEITEPSLHLIEHVLLDAGATSVIVRVVESLEDLDSVPTE